MSDWPNDTASAPSLPEGHLLECLLTTRDADGGVRVSPMGPIFDRAFTTALLRPYPPSASLENLRRDGGGVLHITDDAAQIALAAIGQLDAAPRTMATPDGRGVILYMRQEGRGIGLVNKIKAYALQDQGMDTVEANVKLGFKADHRDYGVGAQILHDLGVRQMRLLTNNPVKFRALKGYGLEIVDRVALEVEPNPSNAAYLRTKAEKLGHVFSFSPERDPAEDADS